MSITCTITKAGRFDEYGRALTVSQSYTGSYDFVKSLVRSGYASVPSDDVFDDDEFPNGQPSPNVAAFTNPVTGGISIYGMVVVPDLVANDASAATANTVAIQKALDTGGRVFVGQPGDIYINSTLTIGDDTGLDVGEDTVLKLAPAANCNLLRTKNHDSALVAVSQIVSADGITATATCTHGQTVGSSKWIFVYGATPEAYNGVRKVTFTTASAFAYTVGKKAPNETLTTPATGTIKCALANGNITINGAFDYDTLNQTTPDSSSTHAIYLRRVGNLDLGDSRVLNAKKYAIHVVNFQNVTYSTLKFDTASDGIHLGGSGKQLVGGCVIGKSGDDLFAVTQGDYPNYTDAGYIIGNFDEIHGGDIISDGAWDAAKVCVQSGYSFGTLSFDSIRGRFSGGAALVHVMFDAGIVQQDGVTPCTNGVIKSLKIGSLDSRQLSSNPLVSITATLNNLQLSNLTAELGSAVGASTAVIVGPTGSLGSVQGGNWDISGASVNALGVLVVSGGSLGNVQLQNIKASTLGAMVQLNSGSLSTGALEFSNVNANAMSTFINTAVRLNGSAPIPCLFSNVRYTTPVGAFLTGLSASAQVSALFSGCYIPPGAVSSGTWLNVIADFTPEQRDTITYAATITPDFTKGSAKLCTFNGAMTIAAPGGVFPSNNQAGRKLTFVLIRNSVGVAAITWNAVYKFPSAFVDSAANTTRTVLTFQYDDNGNWVCCSGANVWN